MSTHEICCQKFRVITDPTLLARPWVELWEPPSLLPVSCSPRRLFSPRFSEQRFLSPKMQLSGQSNRKFHFKILESSESFPFSLIKTLTINTITKVIEVLQNWKLKFKPDSPWDVLLRETFELRCCSSRAFPSTSHLWNLKERRPKIVEVLYL